MWEKFKKWCFENQPDTEPNGRIIRFGLLMAIPILLWLLTGLFTIVSYLEVPDSPGTFGDMFGSVNALFSGMALAGIVYTIFIQKKEFQLQREELKLQRKESKLTREVFIIQRFETTFFNLINLHHDIVKSLSIKIPVPENHHFTRLTDKQERREFDGRYVFEKIATDINSMHKKPENLQDTLNLIFRDNYYVLLAQYLRNLRRIAEIIYSEESLKGTKDEYIKTLQSQISFFEQQVIAYFMLWVGKDRETEHLNYTIEYERNIFIHDEDYTKFSEIFKR
ncbi:hypothetical protein YDYSY3_60820 [Paenibacillus chitinolyticus]|uniref:putative phage abortive infection protein n=1 Tax=Paenibacillus chitinolyticus TaxID=79263 RepID=UPI0026E4B6A3|nr:putative phage abortive infection protein [Paenibacillus chitinolyticus]GKS15082.1 hypothetical protein YDYSY3_60820 [Paenibacillus chitinolyticus]